MKKFLGIAFASAVIASPFLATAPALAATVGCVHVEVNVNGNQQTVDQCV